MLICADIVFAGRDCFTGQVSEPYHQYLVFAEPSAPPSGKAVATIRSVTEPPLPGRRYPLTFEVSQGGERAAFDKAVDALKAQPRNRGLELHIREV